MVDKNIWGLAGNAANQKEMSTAAIRFTDQKHKELSDISYDHPGYNLMESGRGGLAQGSLRLGRKGALQKSESFHWTFSMVQKYLDKNNLEYGVTDNSQT